MIYDFALALSVLAIIAADAVTAVVVNRRRAAERSLRHARY